MQTSPWRNWLVLAVILAVAGYCGYVSFEAIRTGELTMTVYSGQYRRIETFHTDQNYADYRMGLAIHVLGGIVGLIAAFSFWLTRLAPSPPSEETEEPSQRPFGAPPSGWREKG